MEDIECHTWRGVEFIQLPFDSDALNDRKCTDKVVGVVDGSFPIDFQDVRGPFGCEGNRALKKSRKWAGGTNVVKFKLNNKIVGAKMFLLNENKRPKSWRSDPDMEHGRACAAIACGNYIEADYFNITKGTMRGSAPKAKLALYQCEHSDSKRIFSKSLRAGILAAVADRVDILSISVGSPVSILPQDETPVYPITSVGVGTLAAAMEGILSCVSAGNSGLVGNVSNPEPWQLTVSASNMNKRFTTTILLGNGRSLKAHSTNISERTGLCPLVFADDILICSSAKGVFDGAKAKGKIIFGRTSFNPKSDEQSLRKAGVKGRIFLAKGDATRCEQHIVNLPGGSVNEDDFDIIEAYCKSDPNPMAEIFQTTEDDENEENCPILLSFSSKGPHSRAFDIMTPDICAPGHLLVPTVAKLKAVDADGAEKTSTYRIMRGTSMATALVAGAMTQLQSLYPNWSMAALKSAVITTADPMTLTSDEDMLGVGSGVLNIKKARRPGLVYDIKFLDYIHYLNDRKFDFVELKSESNDAIIRDLCDLAMNEKNTIHPRDLNLPILGAAFNDDEKEWTFKRRLTNICQEESSYVCHIEKVDGLTIEVVPAKLEFKNEGDVQSFEVKVKVTEWGKGRKFGFRSFIEWQFGDFRVRSYILVIRESLLYSLP